MTCRSMNLNISTWNVTGLMSSSSYLCELLSSRSVDIVGISDHWLNHTNVHFLNCIDSMYCSVVSCSKNGDYNLSSTTSKGGVAIMWNKRLSNLISPLNIEDDRIIGIQVEIAPSQFIFVIQVYIPCRNHPISYFREYIDKVYDI